MLISYVRRTRKQHFRSSRPFLANYSLQTVVLLTHRGMLWFGVIVLILFFCQLADSFATELYPCILYVLKIFPQIFV